MAHHFNPPCMLGCDPKLSLLVCLVRRNGPPLHPSLHAWLSPPNSPCLYAYWMLCEVKWPTISPLLACLVVTPNSPCLHAWQGDIVWILTVRGTHGTTKVMDVHQIIIHWVEIHGKDTQWIFRKEDTDTLLRHGHGCNTEPCRYDCRTITGW